MANGIDPRISLAAQPINLGQRTAQNISNVANLDVLGQRREQAPFQNRLLELQTGLAEAQQPGQLQVAEEAASPLAQLNRRDKARLQSVVQGAQELSPLLEANDITGARSQLIARKARLTKLNLPTETTDESIELLDTNPDLLRQRTAQAITLGEQAGFIKQIPGQGIQATQFIPGKGFATITKGGKAGLVPIVGVGETVKEKRQADVEASGVKEQEKARLQGATSAVKAAVSKGAKAFDQIAPLSTAIANYDDAIAQLDAGANTGFFASIAPSFKAASIRLDNVVKRLGLDVVGNTTFGALSESELKFALQAAIPTNLQPAELKEWLIAKRDAQKKVKERVEEAASFLSDGTHTLKDWIEFDQARQLNIKNQQNQPVTQPQIAPQAAAQDLSQLSLDELIALRDRGGN